MLRRFSIGPLFSAEHCSSRMRSLTRSRIFLISISFFMDYNAWVNFIQNIQLNTLLGSLTLTFVAILEHKSNDIRRSI